MTLRLEVSLYVSCDAKTCASIGGTMRRMFNGATEQDAAAKFLEAGWLLVPAWRLPTNWTTDLVICPECVGAGRVAAQDKVTG